MKNRILYVLLSLLGFATACSDKTAEEISVAYGTPSFKFRVQGKVTDATGKAVANIEVSDKYDYSGSEKVRTAEDGSYDLSKMGSPYTVRLVFTDTDGPDNGGDFAEQTLEIKFTEADRTGKGDGSGWYSGEFARKDVNITLEEKTSEQE